MMLKTVTDFELDDDALADGSYMLRFICESQFTDSDGVERLAGSVQEFPASAAGGRLTAADFQVASTTDAVVNERGSYRVEVSKADARRTRVSVVAQGLVVPDNMSSPVRWAELQLFSAAQLPWRDTNVYTRTETIREIEQRLSVGNPATTTTLGRVKVDEPPPDAASPVVVSSNSTLLSKAYAVLTSALPPPGVAGRIRRLTDGLRGLVLDTGSRWINLLMGNISVEEYATLAAMIADIGASERTVFVPAPYSVAASATIPANITLKFTGSGAFDIAPGQTVTIAAEGASRWPRRRLFTGSGTVGFTGNRTLTEVWTEWWGAKADGSTDCTAAIQAAIDALNAVSLSGKIKFSAGVYIIAGALQDTSASNAQIVLPKRTTMMSLAFEGAAGAINAAFTRHEGSVLRSTLATGTGNVIGVKGSFSIATIPNNTALSFYWRNLSLQLPDNPTNSGVDLTYVPDYSFENAQITTSVDPSNTANITKATTATSYALKLPPNNVAFPGSLRRVQIFGFYTGIRHSELVDLDQVTITFCRVLIEIQNGYHPNKYGRVWGAYFERGLKFVGGAGPGLAGAIMDAQLVSFEHSIDPNWTTIYDIDDPESYALGVIRANAVITNSGNTSALLINGALDVDIKNAWLPWNSRWNTVQPYTNYDLEDNATFEIYRRVPASGNLQSAALSLVANQSGTSNVVGRLMGVNAALGGADKRIAQMTVSTDGATNSGKIDFATWNAGVSVIRFSILKDRVRLPGLPAHANNAAAVAGGLAAGDLYRTGGDPDAVCVVH